jgi:hypothetical protein
MAELNQDYAYGIGIAGSVEIMVIVSIRRIIVKSAALRLYTQSS